MNLVRINVHHVKKIQDFSEVENKRLPGMCLDPSQRSLTIKIIALEFIQAKIIRLFVIRAHYGIGRSCKGRRLRVVSLQKIQARVGSKRNKSMKTEGISSGPSSDDERCRNKNHQDIPPANHFVKAGNPEHDDHGQKKSWNVEDKRAERKARSEVNDQSPPGNQQERQGKNKKEGRKRLRVKGGGGVKEDRITTDQASDNQESREHFFLRTEPVNQINRRTEQQELGHAETKKIAPDHANPRKKEGVARSATGRNVDTIHGKPGTMNQVIAQPQVFFFIGKARNRREDGTVDYSREQINQKQEKSCPFKASPRVVPEKNLAWNRSRICIENGDVRGSHIAREAVRAFILDYLTENCHLRHSPEPGMNKRARIGPLFYHLLFTENAPENSALSFRSKCLLILMLFVVTRFATICGFECRQVDWLHSGPVYVADSAGYVATAEYVSRHGYMPTEDQPKYRQFAGLSLLMLIPNLLLHNLIWSGYVVVAISATACLFLIQYLFNDFRLSLIACVFLPYWITTTCTIYAEAPTMLCFLIGVWVLRDFRDQPRILYLGVFIAGYSVVLRQSAGFFVIPFLVIMAWKSPGGTLLAATEILCVAMLPLGIYLAWNWITIHEFFPQFKLHREAFFMELQVAHNTGRYSATLL